MNHPGGNTSAGLVLCLALTGCATWSDHGVVLRSQKVPVAVLPVRNEVGITKLEDICAPSGEQSAPDSQPALIRREMAQVEETIRGNVENRLRDSYFFEVIPDARVDEALATLGVESGAASFSTNQVVALGQATGAKAILLTRISGYGKINRKWLVLLVGSGLVEGVVQGGIAAFAVSNPWVGWA